MLRTKGDMENTRICIVGGDKPEDKKLDVIGTTLHYIPRKRYPQEYHKIAESDEVRLLADYYIKNAKKLSNRPNRTS